MLLQSFFLLKFFIAHKVSNIHLVTKDYKIVPLTSLLGLLLAGRVMGVGLVRLYGCTSEKNIYKGKNTAVDG